MFRDYKVSSHWADDDPAWIKSLVSSLDRRHGASSIMPLTSVVDEIAAWVDMASGEEAWAKRTNHGYLRLELDRSTGALGAAVRAVVSAPLSRFEAAFTQLVTSPRTVLVHAPGSRTDAVWTDLASSAKDLLTTLEADGATTASWDDLVTAARDRSLSARQYRPIADLLFDQLQRRGHDSESIFNTLASLVAYGPEAEESPLHHLDVPTEDRIARARVTVSSPAEVEPTVVWLGYQGHAWLTLSAGRVSFMDAQWHVPNARPDGQGFDHKPELWDLVKDGYQFKVAKLVDEESDVELLVRVDLGETTAAGAVKRATDMVETILNVSIHSSGGIHPNLVQHAVLRSGRQAAWGSVISRRETGFPNDSYGAHLTGEAVERHGPRIAQALSRDELPRYLAAAIEVQVIADHPFSRDMALRKPSEADIRSIVPLADRVVQHVAAHAAMSPDDTFTELRQHWPHTRWTVDVQNAVGMCLLGGSTQPQLTQDLSRDWFATSPSRPWVLFVADRTGQLLSVCQVEHERAWITRMLRSVTDAAVYAELVQEYTAEAEMLEGRRKRVRNGLVHGNPTSFAMVKSVREYASFLSSSALWRGLESYIEVVDPRTALTSLTPEAAAMRSSQDAATYWRNRIASQPSS
ncbi:hypothetical protein APR04_002359 [Promicromonospora umidemergens]|uniref:Uncharacterized protein n=1 Tax=Promicromonospora umidemergens TaxID=629679 RepID=A0ABP8WR50_9MICO|nr:hypothetical protein [Promicromonospora umidemergens]MCP2283456.1 hypothetical protein [Promicromonospora umidemergens]